MINWFAHMYPYTNFHELNLDWVIATVRNGEKEIADFIGVNTIKYANPILWNIESQYEANTVVVDGQTGNAYISVKPVPSGVHLNRTEYWTQVYNYANVVDTLREQIASNEGESTTATRSYSVNDLVFVNGLLYRVTSPMIAGDSYVEGSNCEKITVEEFINLVSTTLQGNIDAEATTRESADTTLQSNIDAEATARQSADTTLQSNIDAEATTRQSADTTLQDNIDAEASARESADTTLQDNINAEASARETADTELEETLTAIIDKKLNVYNVRNYGAVGDGSTDDTQAIQDCINACYSDAEELYTNIVYFPQGQYVISSAINVLPNCHLIGNKPCYGFNSGSWIYVTNTDTSVPDANANFDECHAGAFFLRNNVKISGFGFYYPNQTAQPTGGSEITNIITYSPTIVIARGSYGSNVEICDMIVLNPYRFIYSLSAVGGWTVHNIRASVLHSFLTVNWNAEVVNIYDVIINPSTFFQVGIIPNDYYFSYIKENCVTFRFLGADWGHIDNCFAYGVNKFLSYETITIDGTTHGVRHMEVSNCGCGDSNYFLHTSNLTRNDYSLCNCNSFVNCDIYATTCGFAIFGGKNYKISNCTFRCQSQAILMYNSESIIVENCDCIYLGSSLSSLHDIFVFVCEYVIFSGNMINNVSNYGIPVYFNSDNIKSCVITDNIFDDIGSGIAIRVGGSGAIANWCLANNIFTDCDASCVSYSQTITNQAFSNNIPTIS